MIDELLKLGADNPEIASECLTIIQHLKKKQSSEQQVVMFYENNVIKNVFLFERDSSIPGRSWDLLESGTVNIPLEKWMDTNKLVAQIPFKLPVNLMFIEDKCGTLKFKVENK